MRIAQEKGAYVVAMHFVLAYRNMHPNQRRLHPVSAGSHTPFGRHDPWRAYTRSHRPLEPEDDANAATTNQLTPMDQAIRVRLKMKLELMTMTMMMVPLRWD